LLSYSFLLYPQVQLAFNNDLAGGKSHPHPYHKFADEGAHPTRFVIFFRDQQFTMSAAEHYLEGWQQK
jgi:hypothetical protein